jgi:hypothetical protein
MVLGRLSAATLSFFPALLSILPFFLSHFLKHARQYWPTSSLNVLETRYSEARKQVFVAVPTTLVFLELVGALVLGELVLPGSLISNASCSPFTNFSSCKGEKLMRSVAEC